MTKFTLFFTICLALTHSIYAQVRMLTNNRGLKIEAEVISVNGENVTIKRVSDGRTFEIPVNTLIAADQTWLKSFSARASGSNAISPGAKWLLLTVEIPHPGRYNGHQRPRVIGVRDSLPVIQTGATTFDLLLPLGAWVHINTRSYGGSSISSDYLVKFNGERHWKVRVKDDLFLVSRDGQAEEVAGLTLPSRSNDFPAMLSQTERYKPGLSVSLDIPSGTDYGVNPSFGSSQIAMVISATSTMRYDLGKILPDNLKALYINLDKDSLSHLSTITELEALDLRLYTSRNDPDPPLSLSFLPQVRDLYLGGFPNNLTLHDTLLKQKGLRCLSMSPEGKGTVLFQGINQLKTLELLNMSDCQFDATEYCSLPMLRAVSIDTDMFAKDDPGLSNLGNLRGVQLLSPSYRFPKAVKEWAQSGALAELERLSWGAYFPPEFSPKLNYVKFGTISTRNKEQVSLSEYSYLPNLEHFEVSGIDMDTWRVLSTFKSREKLKTLEIDFSGDIMASDQSAKENSGNGLSAFKNLARLELLESDFKEIDLTQLPFLEAFEIRNSEVLTKISGIDTHNKLRSFNVNNCKILKSIGGTLDNLTLQSVYLNQCPQLTDASGLNTAKRLKIVTVNQCDGLKDPQPFLDSNQLLEVKVSRCRNLRDRSISR